MSVPILLTVLEPSLEMAQAALTSSLAPLLLEEHIKDCATYGEAAAVIAPKFTPVAVPSSSIDATESETALADAQNEANAKVISFIHPFTVTVCDELADDEIMAITGDTKALGEWQLEQSLPLRRKTAKEWGATVLLQMCGPINYRYLVYTLDADGRKQVRRWETQLKPRTVDACNAFDLDRFGEVEAGEYHVNRGWLTSETIIQLKFEREKMFQVLDIDKFDTDDLRIKLELQLQPQQQQQHHNGHRIEVARLEYGESRLRPQPANGIAYRRGEVLIFHVTMPTHSKHTMGGYQLKFYSQADEEQRLLGETAIDVAQVMASGSGGMLELPIIDAMPPTTTQAATIARLSLPFVVVRPFTDVTLDFRTTYAHYWPKSWPNLDIGHRGNGKSFIANPPAERENTIASFLAAYRNYADMIELDVHLTADHVPIIYHDFGIRTAPQNKVISRPDQLEYVLIKDIEYERLKGARVFAIIDNKPIEYPSHNAEPRFEHRIFPRLLDVLEHLPKTLGIDVEIKWPQQRATGTFEAEQTIDKNFFIDRIIADVITHGCGRPLIFSSFDADICTMLRFKQNIFPVMYLTMGETKKWTQFMDLRTRNFVQAINNAQAFELAGTAPHAEDFLHGNGSELMELARRQGQITVIWGDDCNSKESVRYFNEIGATGTCYDRSDLYMPDDKGRSFFNSTTMQDQFNGQCRPIQFTPQYL